MKPFSYDTVRYVVRRASYELTVGVVIGLAMGCVVVVAFSFISWLLR